MPVRYIEFEPAIIIDRKDVGEQIARIPSSRKERTSSLHRGFRDMTPVQKRNIDPFQGRIYVKPDTSGDKACVIMFKEFCDPLQPLVIRIDTLSHDIPIYPIAEFISPTKLNLFGVFEYFSVDTQIEK